MCFIISISSLLSDLDREMEQCLVCNFKSRPFCVRSGHFLSTDCSTGSLSIPVELLQYSLRENANIEASLRYLVGESTVTENVDPILRYLIP